MSTSSSLRERLGRPARTSDDRPDRSGTPVFVELRADRPLARPVSLAQALEGFGLDLEQAHRALDTIKARRHARLELYVSERSGPLEALEAFGLAVRRVGSAP
ncbi:hypothetical protein [Methylobacterium oxalidis]|uniref:Uncharacterized protein n=1 Tax=Methylobacterium oxalidis TaxID=944322 RepID=A0A512JC80_9HYPH|nr:hypothetical protein [Methylobacterium oxalidis]GEP07553.1 hypothetical protein MOX02_55910 [Methylobacterium oxalidis]GJE35525.1 hypothetical protein LDDCCGHA_5743 [Methylobacterium oxalidis]